MKIPGDAAVRDGALNDLFFLNKFCKIQSKLNAWIQIFAGKMFSMRYFYNFFQLHLRGWIQGAAGSGSPYPMETAAAPASVPIFISTRRLSQPGIRFCAERVMWAPSSQRMRLLKRKCALFVHDVALLSRYVAPSAYRGALLTGKGAFSTMAAPSK